MLKDLFVNMTILISSISIASQISKKINIKNMSSLKLNIMNGMVAGALGSILMVFSVDINKDTIIDFRNIAIIMPGVFGGTISVIISGFIIAIFRITYFGVNTSSLLGVVTAIVNAIGCSYIKQFKISLSKKWLISTVFILTTSTMALSIVLGERNDFFIVIAVYWISYSVVSAISYFYLNYCITTNMLFERLQKESLKDFLTGLNNVRQFDYILNNEIRNVSESNKNLSLLMIDIDFFKKINDTYGHVEGDYVLKELGKLLYNCCKSIGEVSRNGGEEFSVLLFNCPNAQAVSIAENIRSCVEKHLFTLSTGKQISVTVSLGVASYPETVKDIDNIMDKADTALYSAKREGRNRVCG